MIVSAAECLGVRRAQRVAPIPLRQEAALIDYLTESSRDATIP